MTGVDVIAATTFHGRRGANRHGFSYSVDFVLLNAEKISTKPRLFGRNARGLWSVNDRDNGGPVGQGRGAAWVREVIAAHNIPANGRIDLLTQPRSLGYVFNPVSFWLCHDASNTLRAVISEVSNTFGDRHSYLCHHADFRPIEARDWVSARKIFHVSPFQPVDGEYRFRFGISRTDVNIVIDYNHKAGGVVATLSGPRQTLTTGRLLRAFAMCPLGTRLVMARIFWQALRLRLKGAKYRNRPLPPSSTVSR